MDARSTYEFDHLRIMILVVTLIALISMGAMLLDGTSETDTVKNSSNNSELQLPEEEFRVIHAIYHYVEEEMPVETITTRVYESVKGRAQVTLCAVPTMKIVVPEAMVTYVATVLTPRCALDVV